MSARPSEDLMLQTKRAYEPPARSDGQRILIDRLWPRGLTKGEARVDSWRKDLAPSEELRKWFGHRPERFSRFRERYRMELLRHRDALAELALAAEGGPVTLIYAARDKERCNAAVLHELLEEVARAGGTVERAGPTRARRSRRRPGTVRPRDARR